MKIHRLKKINKKDNEEEVAWDKGGERTQWNVQDLEYVGL